MKIEVNDITRCKKELVITIDKQEALQDYNEVLRKFKNYVVLPGFRKGKAPLSMIERTYGDHAKEEFYNQKLGEYYKAALQQKDLNPISEGELKDVKWDKGQELIVTFSLELKPFIQINKYKGLEIPFEEMKFEPKMVDDTIEDFRSKTAQIQTAETAETGDLLDLTIKFLDEAGKETKSVDRQLYLGENQYSPDFNRKMIGIKKGDLIKTRLFDQEQQPEDADFTGEIKNRQFLVEIKDIKRTILPDINDDFAKDLEYDSLQDLRDKISEELKINLKRDNAEQKKHSILKTLIEANEIEVPSSLIKDYAAELAKPNAEKYKMKIEDVIPVYEKIAEYNYKVYLIINELIKMEKIEISDEDKEDVIKEAAANLNMEIDKYKEMYKKEIESDGFKAALEEKKLLAVIEQSATFIAYPKNEVTEEK